jgi:hypothetical protein
MKDPNRKKEKSTRMASNLRNSPVPLMMFNFVAILKNAYVLGESKDGVIRTPPAKSSLLLEDTQKISAEYRRRRQCRIRWEGAVT